MTLFRSSSALALCIGMIPAQAVAECVPDPVNQRSVICGGTDPDGFAYPVDTTTVRIFGTVTSQTDALLLTGVAPRIVNQGTVDGVQRGVVAPLQAIIENSGFILGRTVAAIDALQGATITNNVGATIRSLSGHAIVAGTGLTLNNAGGALSSAGGAAAVVTGLSAKVLNTAEGDIQSVSGTAIKGGVGLELTNLDASIKSLTTGAAITASTEYKILNSLDAQISAVDGDAISVMGQGTITNEGAARIGSSGGSAISTGQDAHIINTGATIWGTGSAATIKGLSNVTILNTVQGQITAIGGPAIEAGVHLSLTNGPTSVIDSGSGLAVDAGISATVRNSGRISGGAGGVALDAGSRLFNEVNGSIDSDAGPAVSGSGTVDIDNGAGATIASRGRGPAVSLRDAMRSEIVNDGKVLSQSGDAMDIEGGDTIRIENGLSGEIRGLAGAAILTDARQATIENEGVISGETGAIRQTPNGRIALFNQTRGRIESRFGAAVEMTDGVIENDRTALITGETSGVMMASGRLDNSGRIAARADRSVSAAVHVAASQDDLVVDNEGEISGYSGIVYDERNEGRQEIRNTGRIEGTGGTAIRFGSSHTLSTVSLLEDSEILGDVLFGASDDFLNIFDIASGSLIRNGIFDGGAGVDTLTFASSYVLSDFLDVDFLDETSFDVTVMAENGSSLFAQFRSFESVVIGGRARTVAELREDFIAPVPLPAGLPMLLAGLGLIVGLRRASRR